MKTSAFKLYHGPGRISIARWSPRGTPPGFRVFRPLAPGEWFKSVPPERYLELYQREVLARLDPLRTWEELHRLAGGHEPILLCWEVLGRQEIGTLDRGPFNPRNWCHRRIVAQWFAEHLGHQVAELRTAGGMSVGIRVVLTRERGQYAGRAGVIVRMGSETFRDYCRVRLDPKPRERSEKVAFVEIANLDPESPEQAAPDPDNTMPMPEQQELNLQWRRE